MQMQRSILWIIFTLSLLFLWDAWQRHQGQPSLFGGPAPTAQPTASPAGSAVPGAEGRATDASIPAAPVLPATSVAPAAAPSGSPAGGSEPAGVEPIRIRNQVMVVDVDPLGGEIRRVELLRFRDSENRQAQVVLLDQRPGHTYVAQTGLVGPEGSGFPTHRSRFSVEPGPREFAPGIDELKLSMTAQSGGLALTRTYRFKRDSYLIEVDNDLRNVGDQALRPTLYMQLTRDATKPAGENFFYSTFTGPVVYTDQDKFQKVDFDAIERGRQTHSKVASDGWIGVIQHYFVAAWVPEANAGREFYTRKVDTGLYSAGILQPLAEMPPGTSQQVGARLWVGPQDQRALAAVADGLDLTVDYGWLTAISKPLFWLLDFLHSWVLNWGWAIVLLTILVKLAFWPLQAASYRSMAKMKKVTPKLVQIRERYGDDRMKMNQAMMDLYKTEKINPLGGCLPIVVQIPVFIALYWVLLASVEMRDAPWVLWIEDLAKPDPYLILPVLMAATMFIQTKLNPKPPDPLQAKLMMFMPLIFSVMFFFFPAGLVLYWLVNNIFSIAQQWVITRRIEGKPVFGRAPPA